MKPRVLAKVYRRVFAAIIDYGIFMLSILVYMQYFGTDTDDGYEIKGLMVLPIIIFWIVCFIVVEGVCQVTLGHQVLGIKVTKENDQEIDIEHSFKRRILDAVDFSFLGVPAFVVMRNTKLRQRIGDLYAKTIVVVDE